MPGTGSEDLIHERFILYGYNLTARKKDGQNTPQSGGFSPTIRLIFSHEIASPQSNPRQEAWRGTFYVNR